MRCPKVKRLLSRYSDGELKGCPASEAIEQHLKACSGCRAELGSMLSAKNLVSSQERIKLKDGFLGRLKDRLRPQPEIVRLRWVLDAGDLARRIIPVPAFFIAVVMILLFGQLRKTQELPGGDIDILNIYADPIAAFEADYF